MEKIISLGNKEVKLSNNTAWTMEYRDQFGKDIVPVLMPMFMSLTEGIATAISDKGGTDLTIVDIANSVTGRSTEIFMPLYQLEFVDIVNIVWAMAKVADRNIDPPKEWVRQFDEFPLDVVIPTVYDMTLKGFMSSKNSARLKNATANLSVLQPSHSTTSSSLDSKEG